MGTKEGRAAVKEKKGGDFLQKAEFKEPQESKEKNQGPTDHSVNSYGGKKKSSVLREEKKRKRKELLAKKLNPYPHNFKRSHISSQIQQQYGHLKTGESSVEEVQTAGRLMLKRGMGKAAFFNIQDQEGSLQCYLKKQELDKQSALFFSLTDIGDIVGVRGTLFRTKKGELTLRCKTFQILCKSLEPLPEKYHGVENTEIKYRARYLDLITNTKSKKVFLIRSRIMKEIRSFLDKRGFIEVETPVLQPLYGGAAAHPFSTHHRSLNCDLYLKISPELYLKRLIIGGFEKVYELGKNFRNEGIDRSHNPEFVMLEYYEAYTDYLDQMKQFEELVCHIVKSIKGGLKFEYQGRALDFTPPWKRISVWEGIEKWGGFSVKRMSDEELFDKIKSLGSDFEKKTTRGAMIMEAFELTVEKHLWNPVFVLDFPKDMSPLTKEHRTNENLVERFEPFVAGMELGNAYTELNDPVDQRDRLEEQEKQRKTDAVAHPMDYDFAKAIDVGMPPTGGVGLGVERLVLLLSDQHSIRDIILFPTLKPLSSDKY